MKIVENELLLDGNDFSIGDSFEKLETLLSEKISFIGSDRWSFEVLNVVFCGFECIMEFYFKDEVLYSIRLGPNLRRYVSEAEFLKHLPDPVIVLFERIREDFDKRFSLVERKDHQQSVYKYNEYVIELYYSSRDFDSFTVAIHL